MSLPANSMIKKLELNGTRMAAYLVVCDVERSVLVKQKGDCGRVTGFNSPVQGRVQVTVLSHGAGSQREK